MKTATSLQADALKSCVPPGVRGVAGDDVSFMPGFICRGVCAVGGESLSSATEPVPAPPSRTPKLVPKLVRAAAGGGSGRRRAARGGGRYLHSSTVLHFQHFIRSHTSILLVWDRHEFVDSSTLSALHTDPILAHKWVIIDPSHVCIRRQFYTFSTSEQAYVLSSLAA